MATIKDVAKRANVSTTTVSHVINKTRFVAEETRNAVWAAIKELHYSPSAVARSLKVNHTKSIGLLATTGVTLQRTRDHANFTMTAFYQITPRHVAAFKGVINNGVGKVCARFAPVHDHQP